MERIEMHANLKAALRILFMTALFLPGANLMASGIAVPAPAPAPAPSQAQQPKIQKPAAPARPSTAPPADSVDAAQGNQPEAKPSDQQILYDMRTQLDREAMERVRNGGYRPNSFVQLFEDFGGFLMFLTVAGCVLLLIRASLEHRRWNKMVKVQTETHTKLLDKFGSSQELLTYMDSEAGRRFLETPVFDAENRRSIAMPYSRILWSVQIGLIAGALGLGMMSLRGRVIADADADTGLLIFGTMMLTLGIGFLLSGGVSYLMAKYMGLLKQGENGLARSSAHSPSS